MSEPEIQSDVVYLGRIPDGFFEDQMKQFFEQFGEVKQLRLSRNKKTGHSKHYAFIRFADPEVAEIVADTMDNYILFGHRLVCHVVKPEDIHEKLFEGASVHAKPGKGFAKAKKAHNKKRTQEQTDKLVGRLVSKENKKREKLKALGIEYDFEGFASQAKTEKPEGEKSE